jgi:hypothetical protein
MQQNIWRMQQNIWKIQQDIWKIQQNIWKIEKTDEAGSVSGLGAQYDDALGGWVGGANQQFLGRMILNSTP